MTPSSSSSRFFCSFGFFASWPSFSSFFVSLCTGCTHRHGSAMVLSGMPQQHKIASAQGPTSLSSHVRFRFLLEGAQFRTSNGADNIPSFLPLVAAAFALLAGFRAKSLARFFVSGLLQSRHGVRGHPHAGISHECPPKLIDCNAGLAWPDLFW